MILFCFTHSPVGNIIAKEAVDAALAFATYDQPIALLFSGVAVTSLRPQPESSAAGAKDLAKLLKSLPLFDVERVYLCQQSAEQHCITKEQCVVDVTLLDFTQQQALLQEAQHVIRI